MNHRLDDPTSRVAIAARRAANNKFRSTLTGGDVMLSAGVIALGAQNQAVILASVRGCVLSSDDPLDAHDIGDIKVLITEPGIARWHELVFFRIFTCASRCPQSIRRVDAGAESADGEHRQLVILLACEWWLGSLQSRASSTTEAAR